MISFEWGNFASICQEASLPICKLFIAKYPDQLILRKCSVSMIPAGSILFTDIADMVVALISAVLMIVLMVKAHKRLAAVGRKEIIILFVVYFFQLLLQAVMDIGFVPVTSIHIEILASIQIGLILAVFWCLLVNGLVGYQFIEDGTLLSFFGIFLSTLGVAAGITLVSFDMTTSLLGGFAASPSAYVSTIMYGLYFVFPLVAVVVFLALETTLVARNLGEQKPLLNLLIAALCFIASQICMFAINIMICNGTQRAVDGSMFATLLNLSAMIFVYRFWDSITEDEWDNVDDIFA